jgi:hypothetical protein
MLLIHVHQLSTLPLTTSQSPTLPLERCAFNFWFSIACFEHTNDLFQEFTQAVELKQVAQQEVRLCCCLLRKLDSRELHAFCRLSGLASLWSRLSKRSRQTSFVQRVTPRYVFRFLLKLTFATSHSLSQAGVMISKALEQYGEGYIELRKLDVRKCMHFPFFAFS